MKLTRLHLLWIVIGLSFAPFLLILEPEMGNVTYARFLGYVGLLVLWWQIMLGNRFVTRFISEDLVSMNKTHRFLGTYGFLIVASHYGLMLAYYGVDLIMKPAIENSFDQGVKIGALAFYLLFGLWVASAVLRKKLSWDWWKRIHLLAYLIFFAAMLHSLRTIGYSQQQFGFVTPVRTFLFVTFALVVFIRFAQWAGYFKMRYKVTEIEEVSRGVKRIRIKPLGHRLNPEIGQFAYLQYKRFDQAHPFTVSHWVESTEEIEFSIKASGDWTKRLHKELKVGDIVYVDGPYGVYTREVNTSTRTNVMIAGGIGITPFLAWIVHTSKVKHLFYGNQTTKDIAYRKQIDASDTTVTHVLSEEKKAGMMNGYVSVDLIKAELTGNLEDYDFYLCGPPPMMNAVTQGLLEQGVAKEHIRTERFSL